MSTLRINNIEAKSVPASPTLDEKVKITNSSGDVLIHLDGKTAGITTIGINTTASNITFDANSNAQLTGIVTATNFKTGSSNLHSTGLTVGNNFLHSTGINVGTGATIHVPSSNVLTLGTNSNERLRIDSSGRLLLGLTSDSRTTSMIISGNTTGATSFGILNLDIGTTSVSADTNIGIIRFGATGDRRGADIRALGEGTWSAGSSHPTRLSFYTNAANSAGTPTERLRIGSAGQLGIGGANYGTSGQFLKSTGSGSAVQWASVGVSTSSLQVLEQFYLLCDGRSVSTSNGTVTTTNVTTDPNLTDDFAEASGSSLTYHPPTGTTEIIYEYKFLLTENGSYDRFLAAYYVDIDGSEILESRSSRMGSAEYQDTIDVKYGFRVNTGGSNNATTGDRAALTSMTIKTMVRRWASSYAAKLHFLQYYSGTSAVSIVRRPYVGITAIGSLS